VFRRKMLSGMFTTTKVSETHACGGFRSLRHTRRPGGRHSSRTGAVAEERGARKVSVGSDGLTWSETVLTGAPDGVRVVDAASDVCIEETSRRGDRGGRKARSERSRCRGATFDARRERGSAEGRYTPRFWSCPALWSRRTCGRRTWTHTKDGSGYWRVPMQDGSEASPPTGPM
jgi:hypothetical protein